MLFVLLLAAAMAYKSLMPTLAMIELARREDLGAGYFHLWFRAEKPIEIEPGHFAMVRAPGWGQAPLLPRPMSLLSGGTELSMVIKVVGEGSRRMAQAPMGECFNILAPLGKPWSLPGEDCTPLLVAGSIGVVPLVSLAERLVALGHQADGPRPELLSLYGGRTERDLPLADRLAAAGPMEVSTDDGSRGVEGRVTVLLERTLAAHASAESKLKIYTCGPHPMMAAVAQMAAEHQVACDASLEAPMACGYGVCLGCSVKRTAGDVLYTCVDGPCVDAAQIDWTAKVFG